MYLRSASISDVETLELAILGKTGKCVIVMMASADYITTIAEKDEQRLGFTLLFDPMNVTYFFSDE